MEDNNQQNGTNNDDIISRLDKIERRNAAFQRKGEILFMIIFVIGIVLTINQIAKLGTRG